MLIIARRVDEIVTIEPWDLRSPTPIAEIFASGGIEVRIAKIEGGKVRLGIEASPVFRVWRGASLRDPVAIQGLPMVRGPYER
jgi:sRNA-binding carbon storage regulator CsrA